MDAGTYDRWYATPRGGWIGERELALALRGLAPRPGESLLDVGCGTGDFTRGLARALDGRVTGIDIEPSWVAYARQRSDAGIGWVVGDARHLPFPNDSVDLAVAVTSLCFIDDERQAIREMLRVARRRIALGLLNRRSLLWRQKGRHGGSGAYRGTRWHTPRDALTLFHDLPVARAQVRSAIWLPGGGWLARHTERLWPAWLHGGAFLLVVAELADPQEPQPA
ncbi:class I SAM-dependent methyltransferase [Billgrantia azerbaijanica]|nr:class I SAM-dependent methyltransferase [Halomonas azerbaijanica]